MVAGIKMTDVELKERLTKVGYKLLDQYSAKSWNRHVVVQDKYGYKYDIFLYDAISEGYKPEIVGPRNKFSLGNIFLWLKLNKKDFQLAEENTYINARTKLKFYHPKCDEYFYMTWDALFSQNQNCPVCGGRQVGQKTSLSYLFPELLDEWDYDKNKILPEKITAYNSRMTWWICKKCGYHYGTNLNKRTGRKNGCPACSGHVLTDLNRLSIKSPKLSKQWHPTKNGKLTPNDVSYGSAKKVWWICPKGHAYICSVASRIRRLDNVGCIICQYEKTESLIATELKKYCFEYYKSEKEYPAFKNPKTGHTLRYDIYIAKGENLEINGVYIEIHGKQHYKFDPYFHKTRDVFESSKQRDRMKRKHARKNGVYIEVDLRKIKTVEKAIEYIEKFL